MESKKSDEVPVLQAIPERVRWKKVNVTRNYTCENDRTTAARAIVTTSYLLSLANFMLAHGKNCPESNLQPIRIGNGKLYFDCVKCKKTFLFSQNHGKPILLTLYFSTNSTLELSIYFFTCTIIMQFSGSEEYPYEKALTLSVFASGSGLEVVNTILTTLRVPELTFYKYQQYEEIIFCELNRAKEEEYIINAKEEYRLAMENGDHVEVNNSKIPFITVVVDGGWSKRSYRHSFDSKSGVAVIIGARTKKVLWMDIRVKVCAKCSRAKTENRQVDSHRCFKNWEESAQAMEADIIVEGFKKSFTQHGLMYRYVVGDADSPVFYKIKATCFYPGGIEIQKIDCVNHALRCLTTKLHGISKNTTFEKHQRDYIGSKIPQMARDAKGAIDHNSKLLTQIQLNATPPAKCLFNNLNNIPLHVFGDHSRCN